MKGLLLLFVAVTVSSQAASQINYAMQGYTRGDRYFYFPGDDGIIYLVDAAQPVNFEFIQQYTSNNNNQQYLLFTRANPTEHQHLFYGDTESIMTSNFDRSKVTVFCVHGWKGFAENEMNNLLTEAFLKDGDVNVIVFDWSQLSSKGYPTATAGVPAIGKQLGQFINWLVRSGFSSYNLIHLVGFSLGGHMVGNAGRETGGAVIRITALDPAGVNWYFNKNRLVVTDAQYVEVIHTNAGLLGYSYPCGDADFYPNGGVKMPGCFALYPPCSHSRAYKYMASSLKNKHLWANECRTYEDARDDEMRCTGPLVPMGDSNLFKKARGIFRINTAAQYPY